MYSTYRPRAMEGEEDHYHITERNSIEQACSGLLEHDSHNHQNLSSSPGVSLWEEQLGEI